MAEAEARKKEEVAPQAPVKKKKKDKKNIPVGICHIDASFNNTIITFTDPVGNVVSSGSCGGAGFKGSKKSTPFAAQMAAELASKKALECGMRTVNIDIAGPGAGRESAIRAIAQTGLRVTSIRDVTPIPHNGCRPSKRRRV